MNTKKMLLYGFIVAVLIVYGISSFFENKKNYDERQRKARDQANKLAFFVLLLYLSIDQFVVYGLGICWAVPGTDILTGIFFSLTVYLILLGVKGAYFHKQEIEKMKDSGSNYVGLFILDGIIILLLVLLFLFDGVMLTDGMVNENSIVLWVMIMSFTRAANAFFVRHELRGTDTVT